MRKHPDEPLFRVNGDNQTTYIDRTGKVVLTVPYATSNFSEGLARVSVNRPNICDKWGFIDRTEKLVMQFDEAGKIF